MRLVLKVCIIGSAVWVGSHDPVMLENVLQLAEKGLNFGLDTHPSCRSFLTLRGDYWRRNCHRQPPGPVKTIRVNPLCHYGDTRGVQEKIITFSKICLKTGSKFRR